MMQDPRTSKQALAGLFDSDMLYSDEFSRATPEQAPLSVMEQMDERHGKLSNRLGLFGHLLGGGTRTDYGDADLLAAQKATQTQQALQDKMGMAQPYIDMIQDGNPETNMMGMFGLNQMGFDQNMMEMAMPGMAPNDDPDIVRTTNQYVDSYNEANKDKEGFEPMTFHQGYDIVKNYDAGRRGAQAGAVAAAGNSSDSDFATFNTAKNDYIKAFENADMLNDSLANVDRGIEMLQNGEVDTGLFNGFMFNVFGVGSESMGEFNALSKNATIDKLMAFKGPTTDFEFTQSEAAAFASIMKGEDVNEGTMKTAQSAIQRAIKRNATLAESAYGTMTDMGGRIGQTGTAEVVGRNYSPWWQQEQSNPAQPATQDGPDGAAGNPQAMPEAQALEWLKNNNTPENRRYFAETYGKDATL